MAIYDPKPLTYGTAEEKEIAFSDWLILQTDRKGDRWWDRNVESLARRAARKRTWPSGVGVEEVRAYAEADPHRMLFNIDLAYEAYLREAQ